MNPQILLVEDEAFLRELIHLDLQDKGFDIVLASDGEQAIQAIEQQPPALMLLDLLMPRVDGYGVLEYVRTHGYDFPVVILSNLSDPSEQEKCMLLGAKGFVVKSNLEDGELWGVISPFLKR